MRVNSSPCVNIFRAIGMRRFANAAAGLLESRCKGGNGKVGALRGRSATGFGGIKALIGNLLSPVSNMAFLYGSVRWRPLLEGMPQLAWMYGFTLAIAAFQISIRMYSSSLIYGWRFASLAPVRVFWGNLVNFHATLRALTQFTTARLRRRTLGWQKVAFFPVHRIVPKGQRLGESW